MYYYRWLEALHIISVMMWMAGMLYLPRLYVYHANISSGSENDALLQIMERRLLKYIMNPAMIFSLMFGVMLIFIKEPYFELWFHIKCTAIIVMLIIHMMLAKYRKHFIKALNRKKQIYFRILNECVTVLILIIVIMAVVKPF
ncbi:protoporphyrinogen oxidase HemJ [Wolbachia endosymbiont of Howardula sp.]|uniref:protoporphyrinogen oxidase HemJ n=1 Tax=Wolbachia endosymbiont of Howardula sp. TaxID=2916816 RepID=UPI00217F16D8|nr:protoporphyrinogen oxidase HemJ [Wolbachia endosymbiont of Howardula sp.]UWI83067.1 protoporphyrinogen oxidase HemJ [Wolbachia endosymbiont of Howardula sp.]